MRRTVLSLEQALSLPYATERFARLGWRVIRVEAAGGPGLPGDPNRYIGKRLAPGDGPDDRRSYFVAPNVGKEAIAIDLKQARGQTLLQRLIRTLEVDVFCTNTLPARHAMLGVDAPTLRQARPDLIWGAISALGPDAPDVPGYDPVLQAMAGFMELTGERDGPPMLTGIPVIDLKAGDELYAGVLLALLERGEGGRGRDVHVSMLQAAASWLVTVLPLLDVGCTPDEVTRSGNEHRKFVPTSVYPARDGHMFLAIGSDVQWRRLTALPRFAALAREHRATNEGRLADRVAIHREMAAATVLHTTDELLADLRGATIPATRILDIAQVRELPTIASRLAHTRTPDGQEIRLPPPGVDLGAATDLDFPPKYGEHTRSVLAEAGVSGGEIDELFGESVIA